MKRKNSAWVLKMGCDGFNLIARILIFLHFGVIAAGSEAPKTEVVIGKSSCEEAAIGNIGFQKLKSKNFKLDESARKDEIYTTSLPLYATKFFNLPMETSCSSDCSLAAHPLFYFSKFKMNEPLELYYCTGNKLVAKATRYTSSDLFRSNLKEEDLEKILTSKYGPILSTKTLRFDEKKENDMFDRTDQYEASYKEYKKGDLAVLFVRLDTSYTRIISETNRVQESTRDYYIFYISDIGKKEVQEIAGRITKFQAQSKTTSDLKDSQNREKKLKDLNQNL